MKYYAGITCGLFGLVICQYLAIDISTVNFIILSGLKTVVAEKAKQGPIDTGGPEKYMPGARPGE